MHVLSRNLAFLTCLGLAFSCYERPPRPILGYEQDDQACSDGRDNDADGVFDCRDPDCVAFTTLCGPFQHPDPKYFELERTLELCTDGIDNDLDGFFDCADRSCRTIAETCCNAERSPELCTDGVDNDNDGNADCEDTACRASLLDCTQDLDMRRDGMGRLRNDCQFFTGNECFEYNAGTCSDGRDNDGDGNADCDDRDCYYGSSSPCNTPEDTVEKCSDGFDNDFDEFGDTDCGDLDCRNSPDPAVRALCPDPEPENTLAACSDGFDNDYDGFDDCGDCSCDNRPGFCSGRTPLPTAEALEYCSSFPSELTLAECTDGVDNDGNGFTDCDDFSCSQGDDPDVLAICDQEDSFEECTDGLDNDGDGFADCEDFSCAPRSPRAADNFGPADAVACQESAGGSRQLVLELCSDGIDNDKDGSIDCADYDCSHNPFVIEDGMTCPGKLVCEAR